MIDGPPFIGSAPTSPFRNTIFAKRYINTSSRIINGQLMSKRMSQIAWRDWLATLNLEYSITLNFNYATSAQGARRRFKGLLARVDRHFLGRSWCKLGNRRTFAIAFFENPGSNPHLHVLAQLPAEAPNVTVPQLRCLLAGYWKRLVRGGSVHVDAIWEASGISAYVTKQLRRPGHEDFIILSSEFHNS